MNGRTKTGTIVYSVIAGLVVLAVFVLSLQLRKPPANVVYDLVVFGDSCYGNVRDDSAIPAQIEEMTGMSAFNAAFGGTCAGRLDTYENLDYSLDSLSLAALTKAIAMGDFGVQQTMRTQFSAAEYFDASVDALEQVDFEKTGTVVIALGTNDFMSGVAIDNAKDPYDAYSFCGALRSAVRALRKVNPDIRILFVSPTYIWIREQTCEEYDAGYGPLQNYIEAERAVAEEMNVEFLDLYHDFYEHETPEDRLRNTFDGVHPNETGRHRIAGAISDCLKGVR